MEQNQPNLNYIRLYEKLKEILGETKLTYANLTSVVVLLMQSVETYNDVRGIEKRNMIISVLKRFITDKMGNNQELREFKILIEATVPELVDTLIAIDKKELTIKTKKCLSKLFSCCC